MIRHNKKDDKTINPELKQFAGSLVDGVIKTVSESKADELCAQMGEIALEDGKCREDDQLETAEN